MSITTRSRVIRWIGFACLPLALAATNRIAPEALGQAPIEEAKEYWRDNDQNPTSRGLQELAVSLQARERALVRKEDGYAQRETDLLEAEKRLDARLLELEELRDTMNRKLVTFEKQEVDRVLQLVKAVEKMRSGQAAALLSETDPKLSAAVLDRMSRSKAGKTMGAMNPKVAARLAEMLTKPVEL